MSVKDTEKIIERANARISSISERRPAPGEPYYDRALEREWNRIDKEYKNIIGILMHYKRITIGKEDLAREFEVNRKSFDEASRKKDLEISALQTKIERLHKKIRSIELDRENLKARLHDRREAVKRTNMAGKEILHVIAQLKLDLDAAPRCAEEVQRLFGEFKYSWEKFQEVHISSKLPTLERKFKMIHDEYQRYIEAEKRTDTLLQRLEEQCQALIAP